jgi:3-(3-hydroxy-phenyl)propionate hydroxylase
MHRPDAPWPRVLHGRLGQGGQPVWRARRQHRHCRRRQPGLEAGRRAAGRASPALLDSYHQERHEAATRTCWSPTARRAFCGRRTPWSACSARAAIGLAKQHPFARQFVNTGRMAVANTYTQLQRVRQPPAACRCRTWRSAGPTAARGWSTTCCSGPTASCCCWCLAGLSRQPAAPARPGAHAPVRCVQVLGADEHAPVRWSMCATRTGHLQGACHVFGHAWALVRPDAYVAATGESMDAAWCTPWPGPWAPPRGRTA